MTDIRKARLGSRSQKDSQSKVTVNWHHTEEMSPAFKRLMMLLLKPSDSQPVETATTEEERQNG